MSIYQEHILEHYHDPACNDLLNDPTHKSSGYNPTCGDKIVIEIKKEGDMIKEIGFTGDGCAISQAAASMLCEKIQKQEVATLLNLKKDDMLDLLGIELSHNRLKCGLLALETAHKALQNPIKK